MFDPISLGIMAASAAASGISGAAKNKTAAQNQVGQIQYYMDQAAQDAAAAKERNRVLDQYLGRQDEWVAQNQGDLNTGIAGFLPDAQEMQRTGLEGARGSSIDAALGAPNAGSSDVALRKGAPNFVTDTIDKKVSEARDLARDSGMKLARMGSYGDTWQQNNRAIGGTGHKIDTTNTIARGNASLIPYAQDLAEFQVRKPITPPAQQQNPWWTSALDGAAKLGSAYAGANLMGAPVAAAAPNPMAGGGIWAGL